MSVTEERGRELAAAADLLRAHGYAVVSAVQAELWAAWLEQSHERERRREDENQRLVWMVGDLLTHARRFLDGSRPRWYRALQSDYVNGRYADPIVSSEPLTGRRPS